MLDHSYLFVSVLMYVTNYLDNSLLCTKSVSLFGDYYYYSGLYFNKEDRIIVRILYG